MKPPLKAKKPPLKAKKPPLKAKTPPLFKFTLTFTDRKGKGPVIEAKVTPDLPSVAPSEAIFLGELCWDFLKKYVKDRGRGQ